MITSSFITCYHRLYVDIPPVLVISSNLAKSYFNISDLDKKWCFACKADFWKDPYFFRWTLRPYLKSYFCRPYIDTLPMLVTLPYLAKNFFKCSRSWQKQCFVSNSYFWNGPHFLIWTVTPRFYFFISQIVCIYITYLSNTKLSSTEIT